jgi:polar amino acid transport system substrate-binding protein
VPYASPGRLADAVVDGAWDIGLIGAEPKRAELIAFSPAYVEAGAFYLVRADSPIQNNDDVDRPGARVSVAASTAYDLWLTRNLAYAKICRAETPEASLRQFVHEGMDVLADLKERLLGLTLLGSGARMLPEPFTAVQQAVGIPRANIAGAALVRDIVEDIKASGFVAASIGQHSAMGLDVAPAAALEG